jgi:uncharacterized membrane protein YphA (DoxX/SURF4 family)
MKTLSEKFDSIGLFGKRILKKNSSYAIFMVSAILLMAGAGLLFGYLWAIACAALVLIFFMSIIHVRNNQ